MGDDLTDTGSDKSFEQMLSSFLRDDLAPAGPDCLAPGGAAAYSAGALSDAEVRKAEAHLAQCGACQTEVALLARLEASDLPEAEVLKPLAHPAVATDRGASGREADAPTPPTAPSPHSATPTHEARPSEPRVLRDAEPPSGSKPDQDNVASESFRNDATRFPRRRRARQTWMGAAALSVAALLAILVTYRFTPLIDEASRRAAETDSRTSRAGEMEAAKSKDAEEYVPIPAPPEAQPVPTAAPFFSDVLTENQTNVATGSRSEIAGGEFRPAPPPIHAPESTPAQPAAPPLEARPETDRQVIAPPQASKSEKRDARSDVSPAAASAMQATVGPRSVLVVARSNLDVSWRLTGTRIERSDDAGKTWLRQPAPVGAALLAGSAPSDLACWAAGASGTLLRTRDGHEWMRLVSPTSDDIVQVTAWSALNASIRTAGGERFATDDGGQTWSRP